MSTASSGRTRSFPLVKERLRAAGIRGLVVLTAGIPVPEKGSTNTVHLVNCLRKHIFTQNPSK